MDKVISVRFDDGRSEYVLELEIAGLQSFEASGTLLSDAVQDLAEQLAEAGV